MDLNPRVAIVWRILSVIGAASYVVALAEAFVGRGHPAAGEHGNLV